MISSVHTVQMAVDSKRGQRIPYKKDKKDQSTHSLPTNQSVKEGTKWCACVFVNCSTYLGELNDIPIFERDLTTSN